MLDALKESPHRRFNPLTSEWVLVSPHRTKRPWQGAVEPLADSRPSYDPKCYLCPGNVRANGEENPHYKTTYVFTNDFSALLPEQGPQPPHDPLFRAEPASGECRVICFSPRHDLTLAGMDQPGLEAVAELWRSQSAELGQKWKSVQIFENKGAVMGCSNPHPHGQIWAGDFIPTLWMKEMEAQAAYFVAHGRELLLDMLVEESSMNERIVVENSEWVWLVPFWATWPYEGLLLPRRPAKRLHELDDAQLFGLAEVLGRALRRSDQLFQTSFPYSMGWHEAPNNEEAPGWQLHAHLYPPLLRSATVKKFMVGYEMLGESQRDITPEQAAEALKKCSDALLSI